MAQNDPRLDDYAQLIRHAHPRLPVHSWRHVQQEGQYNDALVVNETLIFRFPRYEVGIMAMRREVNFLRGIRGRTTLPVPDPLYTRLDGSAIGEVYMGYPLLPGEPLWRPFILGQTDTFVIDGWAQQLAGFLRELHAIPPGDLPGDWEVSDTRPEWASLYEEIREHLFPLMRADARKAIHLHFETYLDTPDMHDFTPAPRHGDFGSGNILYDPVSMDISGIIDFGFAAVGDPALDVAAVSTLGDALLGRMTLNYPAINNMLARARFYRGTYALQEALHGYKHGDAQAFEAGMASYI